MVNKTKQLVLDNIYLVPSTGHGEEGLALSWKQEIKLSVLTSCANLIDTCVEYEGKMFYASFIYGDCDKPKKRLFGITYIL